MNLAIYLSQKLGHGKKRRKETADNSHLLLVLFERRWSCNEQITIYRHESLWWQSFRVQCHRKLHLRRGENKADLLDWGQELSEFDVQGVSKLDMKITEGCTCSAKEFRSSIGWNLEQTCSGRWIGLPLHHRIWEESSVLVGFLLLLMCDKNHLIKRTGLFWHTYSCK